MKRLLAFCCAFSLFVPLFALAATEGPDIGIRAIDISFSEETLIAGSTVRLYATLQNKGTTDISGYVAFFQGEISVGTSQVVTLVADGLDEQVWVDFTVPQNPFNIKAEVRGTDPQDVNSANDLALTPLFTPINDDDGDGVANEEDNCPDDKNANQKDSDADGEGDVCDDDDDNDSLNDDVEGELGTDATSKDSDGDGVNDATDAFPLDSSKTKQEVAPVTTSTTTTETTPTSSSEASSGDSGSEPPLTPPLEGGEPEGETVEEIDLETATIADAEAKFVTSPKAAFEYSPIDWKTYAFRVLASADGAASINWDFGDGVTSAQREVTHAYQRSGKYQVTLTVVDSTGESQTDTQEIEISYFHLGNPIVKIIVALLSLLLISSLILALHRSKKIAAVKRLSLGADGGVKATPDGVEEDVETVEDVEDEEVADEDKVEEDEAVEDATEDEPEKEADEDEVEPENEDETEPEEEVGSEEEPEPEADEEPAKSEEKTAKKKPAKKKKA